MCGRASPQGTSRPRGPRSGGRTGSRAGWCAASAGGGGGQLQLRPQGGGRRSVAHRVGGALRFPGARGGTALRGRGDGVVDLCAVVRRRRGRRGRAGRARAAAPGRGRGGARPAPGVGGDNFSFGHKAVGDVPLLTGLGERFGFLVHGVALLSEDEVTVSSTYVRSCVAAGDVEAARAALGRPHRVEGVVVRGQRRGRDLGYPTANVDSAPHTAIPADGVYAAWFTRYGYDTGGSALEPGVPYAAAVSVRSE